MRPGTSVRGNNRLLLRKARFALSLLWATDVRWMETKRLGHQELGSDTGTRTRI